MKNLAFNDPCLDMFSGCNVFEQHELQILGHQVSKKNHENSSHYCYALTYADNVDCTILMSHVHFILTPNIP